MNPLLLLVVGGVALMAMTKKKAPVDGGNGTPSLPDAERDDHVVEEGLVTSVGGTEYASRIWRLYENENGDYLGELSVDAEWMPGPLGHDLPAVRGGLQEMADSLDQALGFDPQTDPCAGAIEGMFTEQAFAAGTWSPTGLGITPDLAPEPYTWCVLPIMSAGQVVGYEGRMVHRETREILFVSAPQAIADIAASQAAYAAHHPFGPFPWLDVGGGFGLQG